MNLLNHLPETIAQAVTPQPESESALRVEHVSLTFPDGNGGLEVLRDISFSVASEEFLCILGPSGSGKSTLLRILAGLLLPSQGEIFYFDEPLLGPRRSIGLVFQKANLMPWRTVLENIALPLELQKVPLQVARQKAQELVDLVGLNGFEQALPRDLSGGMAQRVAIARALVHDPGVLLLDEPFGALDALNRERMGEELLRIWQLRRKTVIMVTHAIQEALFLADRILVFSPRPGQICLEMPVYLPRPRLDAMRYSAVFGEMAERLHDAIT